MPSSRAIVPVRCRSLLAAALASALSVACGGGGDGVVVDPAAAGSGGQALAGTVAVGAPITNGKLRILDANGAVVAADVAIDADGRYADVALTGPAPYRIEACGYAGPNYLCVYSIASGAGTANVTPLTSAMVLLATGQSPDALMAANAPSPTASGVSAAQEQLRASLASVIAGAGASGTLDFVSGDLAAGSRSGYDGVLDAVGVAVGQDSGAFVQITPRLGAGNLYLQQGSTVGTVTAANTSNLQLSGLETLFRNMSAALASPSACADATTGIRRSLSAAAQMTFGDSAVQGPDAVGAGLCQFFAQGDDESTPTPMWGSTLLSPTLGRCDLSGPVPVCGISFVLQSPAGDVMPVGDGMAVTQEAGAWKFMGDLLPIQIRATARAQRTLRVDGGATVDYNRAIQFDIAAVSGLACARVAQRNADGAPTTIGYYKRHLAAPNQKRLSLWSGDGMGMGAGLDPLVGATRSGDDTWLALPEGSAGDAVVRNFYRGGRTVTVSLFSDAACSTPFTVVGRSQFDVDIEGVPPVWSAMESLPWPELDAATVAALRTLAIGAGSTGSFHAGWSFARGPLGLDDITVCGNRGECGDGGTGRVGSGRLRPSARDSTVPLSNRGEAIGADSSKMLALSGRNAEGVGLQSNYTVCPQTPAGDTCH